MYQKKAFTLIELMVVLVIVATLASLAIAQYGKSVEKSRGAEAREVLGVIRGLALAFYNECGSFGPPCNINAADLNIGAGPDMAPNVPRASHFFTYNFGVMAPTGIRLTATRCSGVAGCKAGGSAQWNGDVIQLDVAAPSGTDVWTIPDPWN